MDRLDIFAADSSKVRQAPRGTPPPVWHACRLSFIRLWPNPSPSGRPIGGSHKEEASVVVHASSRERSGKRTFRLRLRRTGLDLPTQAPAGSLTGFERTRVDF